MRNKNYCYAFLYGSTFFTEQGIFSPPYTQWVFPYLHYVNRHGLRLHTFHVIYQPVYNFCTDETVRWEALLFREQLYPCAESQQVKHVNSLIDNSFKLQKQKSLLGKKKKKDKDTGQEVHDASKVKYH